MSPDESIFRKEALEHKKNVWLGDFSVELPSITRSATTCAGAVLIMAFAFLFFPYSERVPVSGSVLYSPAAAEAQASLSGVVESVSIQVGQRVAKGDVLATLSHETAFDGGNLNESLIAEAKKQWESLDVLQQERRKEGEEQRRLIEDKITNKTQEITAIVNAHAGANKKVTHLANRVKFYTGTQRRGLTTVQDKMERENDLNDAIYERDNLNVSLARARGEALQQNEDYQRSLSAERADIAALDQQKHTLKQQIISSSAAGQSSLIAPISGIVTAINMRVGSKLAAGAAGAVIVPESARPLVEILLPASALQDIKKNDHVYLRITSLPWEWFGKVKGEVTAISITPRSLNEADAQFLVTVTPDATLSQLPSGVRVDGDILTKRRLLWEWLFIPIKNSVNRLQNEG
ncbi:HlyD family efflux transporter periplasmic adaptor subunit [Salmonella enterica]|nr:HlyD family efflux transporter periplasmic adaptor subunit [Salmonella enterica]